MDSAGHPTATPSCTDDVLIHARSIYRRPLDNRWASDIAMSLTVTPWSLRSKPDASAVFPDAVGEEAPAPRRIETMPRTFRINYQDLVTHGFTDGCPQCDHNARHQHGKEGTAHTQACRARMFGALMSTPEGRVRLEAFEERVDQAMADRIGAADAPSDERQLRLEPGPARGGGY